MLLVMLCLIPYICYHRVNLRLADRKCSIATLPCKLFIFQGNGLYPSAAISLHLLNNMRNGFGFRKQNQCVYMVLYPANAEHLTASCIDKCPDVCMHLRNMLFIHHRTRCLCVEDDV